MNQNTSPTRAGSTPLVSSFDRYFQDKGKDRDGGNRRQNEYLEARNNVSASRPGRRYGNVLTEQFSTRNSI